MHGFNMKVLFLTFIDIKLMGCFNKNDGVFYKKNVLWLPYSTAVGKTSPNLIYIFYRPHGCCPPLYPWFFLLSWYGNGTLDLGTDIPPGTPLPVEAHNQLVHVLPVPPLDKLLVLGHYPNIYFKWLLNQVLFHTEV